MKKKLNLNNLSNSQIKYRLVIDIDQVLCQDISVTIDKDLVLSNFPNAVLLNWEGKYSNYLYFCYPNFDKLTLSILSWEGWSVDFFSGGYDDRNKILISNYFTQKFANYSHNPQETYQSLVNLGRLQTYSSNHLIEGDREYDRNSYEHYGRMKKDLTVISKDLNNIILADDDRSYILGNQYPYIGLSWESHNFASNLNSNSRYSETLIFDPNKNAAYIMGIILECKKKMDNNEAPSLREALDLVLKHNGETRATGRNYSPWYLNPTHELTKENMENSPYYLKIQNWLESGENYFDKFYELNLFE